MNAFQMQMNCLLDDSSVGFAMRTGGSKSILEDVWYPAPMSDEDYREMKIAEAEEKIAYWTEQLRKYRGE